MLLCFAVYARQAISPGQSSPKLYATQCRTDLALTLTKALADAKQSILLVIFALSDCHILHALNQKAEEGVQVTLIIDPKSYLFLKSKLNWKVKTYKREGLSGLMHRKILIIDNTQVWIGSANFTSESLKVHDNLIVGMESKSIASTLKEKIDQTLEGKAQKNSPSNHFKLGDQSLELWLLPEDIDALNRLTQLIRTAKKTVKVAMFTWTHPDLTEAIIEAHKRGVDVEIVIDRQTSKGASRVSYERLCKSGLKIGTNRGNQLLHHKFAYIDGETLINGSANWTRAAFSINEDCFLILQNLTDEQKKYLNRLWKVISQEAEFS